MRSSYVGGFGLGFKAKSAHRGFVGSVDCFRTASAAKGEKPCWDRTEGARGAPFSETIRAVLLIALIQTPYRFRTKRQLWIYSGRDTRQCAVFLTLTGNGPASIQSLDAVHDTR